MKEHKNAVSLNNVYTNDNNSNGHHFYSDMLMVCKISGIDNTVLALLDTGAELSARRGLAWSSGLEASYLHSWRYD